MTSIPAITGRNAAEKREGMSCSAAARSRRRTLHVSGTVRTKSGSAVVRIRQNELVTEPQLREDGSFAVTLHCSGGGNYIMVDYEDFCGDIVLHAEYVPDASGQEAR